MLHTDRPAWTGAFISVHGGEPPFTTSLALLPALKSSSPRTGIHRPPHFDALEAGSSDRMASRRSGTMQSNASGCVSGVVTCDPHQGSWCSDFRNGIAQQFSHLRPGAVVVESQTIVVGKAMRRWACASSANAQPASSDQPNVTPVSFSDSAHSALPAAGSAARGKMIARPGGPRRSLRPAGP